MTTASPAQPQSTNKFKQFLFGRPEKPFANPYIGGAMLGVVLFLAIFLSGNGLGASGGLNRFIVYLEDLVAPQHIDRVAYLLKMAGGAKNALDDWIVFITLGAILGGFFSGWLHGRLKVETNKGPQISVRTRWIMAFAGGARLLLRNPGTLTELLVCFSIDSRYSDGNWFSACKTRRTTVRR